MPCDTTVSDTWNRCSNHVGKQCRELRMAFAQWGVVWNFTPHNNTCMKMKSAVRLYITQQYIHEGLCETPHQRTIHSWSAVRDFTSQNHTFMKGGVGLYIKEPYVYKGRCETLHHIAIHSWRVVWACTSHNSTFMKGGVRLDITEPYIHKG